MENFELIEKYIGGRLEGTEKEAFEKQLQTNPSLQNDVALQKHIIEGIKKTRIAEIKALLNQVPISGAMQMGATVGKIVTGIITAGTVATVSLLYFKPWVKPIIAAAKTEIPVTESKKSVAPIGTVAEPKENKPDPIAISPKSKKEVAVYKPSKAAQPKIDVLDPTDELTKTSSEKNGRVENSRSDIEASHIMVETDNSNLKYPFHYQFNQGKLILFGSFDKGLYEILEVHGDAHALFLFFKGTYYNLNEKQSSIAPLTPIKNDLLIRKLNEYRSK